MMVSLGTAVAYTVYQSSRELVSICPGFFESLNLLHISKKTCFLAKVSVVIQPPLFNL